MGNDPNSITIPTPVAPPNTDVQPTPVQPTPVQPASDQSMTQLGAVKQSLNAPTNAAVGTVAQAGTPPTPTLAPNTPAAASTTKPVTPAPQTKGEWFSHILKAVTPTQPVIRTNPDGSQSVTDQRTTPSMSKRTRAGKVTGKLQS